MSSANSFALEFDDFSAASFPAAISTLSAVTTIIAICGSVGAFAALVCAGGKTHAATAAAELITSDLAWTLLLVLRFVERLAVAERVPATSACKVMFVSLPKPALRVRIMSGDGNSAVQLSTYPAALGQLAINGVRQRVFIGEPQKHKAHNRHQYVDREDQPHVSGRKIVCHDHLINMTAGCTQ